MKKVLLCILLIFSLFACHGKVESHSFVVPKVFDENKNYELTFWAKNDTNKTQVAIYEQAIEEFEKLYPNIKITLRLYTDYGRIYNDVITNIQTNTTPNICITYPDHIATYMTGQDVIVPLDLLVNDEKYGLGGSALKYEGIKKDEIVDQFFNECKINNTLYALPFMRSSEALYMNATYIEELGYEIPEIVSWDFIWEVSKAAMAKDESGNYLINQQNIMIPVIYKSTDNMMIQMLKQLDAPYANEKAEILIFNDTVKKLLLELSAKVEEKLFSTFKISSYPGNFLNAGQCLFAIDSTAGATWMGSKAPLIDISEDKLVEFETAVRPVPQLDSENIKMISQGPSLCIFNKDDPGEVLASWLFMQYLLTNDVQIAYAQTEGYIPVTKNAQNAEAYTSYLNSAGIDNDLYYDVKISASKLMIEHIEDTFTTPVFNGSASLRDAAGQLIENVVKSVRRKEIVDEVYIDKLFEDVEALYHLDQTTMSQEGKKDLGELPKTSRYLLFSLVIVWGGIIVYVLVDKKRNGEHH